MPRRNTASDTDAARPIGDMRVIALEDLLEDPGNVRPKKDEDIAGLAQSIASVGLLYAPIVRPDPEETGKYRIVAGYRRVTAMRRLKWESVACMVLAGDADEPNPDVVRVVENHQRKDLTPLEEAAAVRALLDRNLEIKTVARSLGRSRTWVARRASLTDLSEVWVRAVHDPDDAISRWPPSHLEMISRFPAETQDRMLEYWRRHWPYHEPPPLRDLDQACANFQKLLKGAPWNPEDETLVPEAGACAVCPKRSSQRLELFPEELPVGDGKVVKGDRCLDEDCWERKAAAFLARRTEELSAKHPDLVLVNNNEHESDGEIAEQFPGRPVANAWELVRCGKNDPGARAALVVAGPGIGRVQYVRADSEPEAVENNGHAESPEPAPMNGPESSGETLARKREAYDKRRRQWVVDTVRDRLKAIVAAESAASAAGIEGAAALVEKGLVAKTLFLLHQLLGEHGWRSHAYDRISEAPEAMPWESLGRLANHDLGKGETRDAALEISWRLARMALDVAARRLLVTDRENEAQYSEAERLCAMLGFDLAALRSAAGEAVPYAKAWREEVEDDWNPPRAAAGASGEGGEAS